MLLEALEYCLTPCPSRWREMGYLKEQIAIDARLRRNEQHWTPHLCATRAAVLEATKRCPRRRCVLLLGAGLYYDLPVRELLAHFDEVWLADLVHRGWRQWRLRRSNTNLRIAEFDATGALERIHEAAKETTEAEYLRWVEEAQPGLPAGMPEEPDLVVSANLCSQLMLLPVEWIERRGPRSEHFLERMEETATRRHLSWLKQRAGLKVLVSETARLRVAPDGSEQLREKVPGLGELPEPARQWRWRLAPIPERSREHHVESDVAAWIL